MAKKVRSSSKFDKEVARELENAIETELAQEPASSFENPASLEDLEARISQAAEEIARETRADASSDEQAPLQPAFSPANDDRQRDYRAIVHRLNDRRSNRVYWAVALLTALWLGGAFLLANALLGQSLWTIRSVQALLAQPNAILLAVLTLVPIVLFWAFAVMIRRAQEMRVAAESMTELALRLVEPKSNAQERVMMVGHAVRREVLALNEGIERTLARAVELETLVQTEVNQLEQSYVQNQRRIRQLVDGLGSEREAVVLHAERVRTSISGAHETLKEELGAASEAIRDQISGASSSLAQSLTRTGDEFVERMNASGSSISTAIDERLSAITEQIASSGEAFASLLDSRIAAMGHSSETAARTLGEMLEERAAGIVSLLGDATRALDAEIGTRLEGIENTLAERGQSLIGHFETRVDALDTGTERLNAALEARARQINDTLVERAREIAATFAEGKDGVAEMIDQRATRVRSDINDMVESAATMIDGRVSHFSEQMEASRSTLSRALDTDLERLTQARVEIDASAAEEARLLGETGNRVISAVQDELRRLADERVTIETAVGSHVNKLAEGRARIVQAMDEDTNRVDELRRLIDLSVANQIESIDESRARLSQAIQDDLKHLQQAHGSIDEFCLHARHATGRRSRASEACAGCRSG